MDPKIIRYQNYGCVNSGPVDENNKIIEELRINFYCCFFELNNGKFIYSWFDEYIGQTHHNSLTFAYTKKFMFGDDFLDWDATTFSDSEINLPKISSIELEVVKSFFVNHIEKNIGKKTSVISV